MIRVNFLLLNKMISLSSFLGKIIEVTVSRFWFEITVDREIETTGGINRIASQACKEGDWGTISFLNGNYSDGKLIPEQIEEESISRTALDIMRMDASILRRQKEVYDFYFNKRK